MKVAIAWHGLPYYAARQIQPVAGELEERLSVLATPGPQTLDEIEAALGAKIQMVAEDPHLNWKRIGMATPDLFFHTGWAYPNFRNLAREVKRHGGMVVCMIDNTRKRNLRQAVGKHVFRWFYRSRIDFALVPGASGQELMKYFEFPQSSVYVGTYGADPKTFLPGPPLAERRYDFLFAGQFIARKGLVGLTRAVRALRAQARDFKIAAVGDGPMRKDLEAAGIEIHPFADADGVAQLMREARFLVLPSIEDHWGLVVHEAALSGCGLVLSRGVGAHLDLLTPCNGFVCEPGWPEQAMRQALNADGDWLAGCRQESLRLASGFGPEQWRQAFWKIYAHAENLQQASKAGRRTSAQDEIVVGAERGSQKGFHTKGEM
jgi:glycosyltransferase involved in cell wall biosynthesis